MVKAELSKDAEFKDLADWIEGGCGGRPEDLPLHLKQYSREKNKLRLVESVPMLVDRTVVPVKLRSQVLETLHSAHQGVLSMGLKAEQAVYWPGFWSDIESTRATCSTCDKICLLWSHSFLTIHLSISVWTTCNSMGTALGCMWTGTRVGRPCTRATWRTT